MGLDVAFLRVLGSFLLGCGVAVGDVVSFSQFVWDFVGCWGLAKHFCLVSGFCYRN